MVEGRGHQARDDQLPHAQAGKGRLVRRAHLRSHEGLGVLLRQVQAHPLQGHHLRQVRRGSHPQQGPPRADGPHPAGLAGQPHLVFQGHAQPAGDPPRHQPAQPRADPVLRPVHRHPRRRGRPAACPAPARRGGRGSRRPGRQGPRRARGRAARRAQPPEGRAEPGPGGASAWTSRSSAPSGPSRSPPRPRPSRPPWPPWPGQRPRRRSPSSRPARSSSRPATRAAGRRPPGCARSPPPRSSGSARSSRAARPTRSGPPPTAAGRPGADDRRRARGRARAPAHRGRWPQGRDPQDARRDRAPCPDDHPAGDVARRLELPRPRCASTAAGPVAAASLRAGMGAEAVRDIIQRMDLDELGPLAPHRGAHLVRPAPQEGDQAAAPDRGLPALRHPARVDDPVGPAGHPAGPAADGPARRRPLRDLRPERPLPARHQPQQPPQAAPRARRARDHHPQREADAPGGL